jgi:hypothetical protein
MDDKQPLTEDVLSALLCASEEGDFEAADYLLQALEARAQSEETEENAIETYSRLKHSLDVKHRDQ